VLLSDGFPSGYLPRPRAPATTAERDRLSKPERVQSYRDAKDHLKARWLTVDEFNRVRQGGEILPGLQPEAPQRVVSKNQIDRLTDTAGGSGGALYEFTQFCLGAVDVYWKIADGYEDMVLEFLKDLQQTGYGKRRSVGYGEVASFTLDP